MTDIKKNIADFKLFDPRSRILTRFKNNKYFYLIQHQIVHEQNLKKNLFVGVNADFWIILK